ncbi:cupin domain-containing protein [Patescibacteria group bacterium]|uniref:Putative cupin domain-containing protein n=1 Tax=viral metagenome TaxID=1070528 RepID=A0A6M3MEZ3_9ZZZZ|nr:cupin domain-containing protein [Patescibacteria group bacterium]MBU0776875.1 cupin domain-containing protein [Patescibacteria group bacterium]MBU0846246.1 cupin domain-containing protein [Patescibacteria group bacterium]MBU0922593.1 cupin domain-containing protein [Patescibacteria group bacterium]MBU1066644.1 cupin domain-containing protein [Patescibacteria group bacterium]
MAGYITDIEKETKENTNFRKVLFTGPHSQLVVMSLKPGEDIGEEIHSDVDQFIRIEEGEAKVVLDGEETEIKDDWATVIPAGAKHNIINTSQEKELKLYTIYTPAEHKDGTIHKTKEEAMADEHDHA